MLAVLTIALCLSVHLRLSQVDVLSIETAGQIKLGFGMVTSSDLFYFTLYK